MIHFIGSREFSLFCVISCAYFLSPGCFVQTSSFLPNLSNLLRAPIKQLQAARDNFAVSQTQNSATYQTIQSPAPLAATDTNVDKALGAYHQQYQQHNRSPLIDLSKSPLFKWIHNLRAAGAGGQGQKEASSSPMAIVQMTSEPVQVQVEANKQQQQLNQRILNTFSNPQINQRQANEGVKFDDQASPPMSVSVDQQQWMNSDNSFGFIYPTTSMSSDEDETEIESSLRRISRDTKTVQRFADPIVDFYPSNTPRVALESSPAVSHEQVPGTELGSSAAVASADNKQASESSMKKSDLISPTASDFFWSANDGPGKNGLNQYGRRNVNQPAGPKMAASNDMPAELKSDMMPQFDDFLASSQKDGESALARYDDSSSNMSDDERSDKARCEEEEKKAVIVEEKKKEKKKPQMKKKKKKQEKKQEMKQEKKKQEKVVKVVEEENHQKNEGGDYDHYHEEIPLQPKVVVKKEEKHHHHHHHHHHYDGKKHKSKVTIKEKGKGKSEVKIKSSIKKEDEGGSEEQRENHYDDGGDGGAGTIIEDKKSLVGDHDNQQQALEGSSESGSGGQGAPIGNDSENSSRASEEGGQEQADNGQADAGDGSAADERNGEQSKDNNKVATGGSGSGGSGGGGGGQNEEMGHVINTSQVPTHYFDLHDHSHEHQHHHHHKQEEAKKKPEPEKQAVKEEIKHEKKEEEKKPKEEKKKKEKKKKEHKKVVEEPKKEVKKEEPKKEVKKEEPIKVEKGHHKHQHKHKEKHAHIELHQHKHFENHHHINLNDKPVEQAEIGHEITGEPMQHHNHHDLGGGGGGHEEMHEPHEMHHQLPMEGHGMHEEQPHHHFGGHDHQQQHHQIPMKEEWIVPELHQKPSGEHHPHGAIVIEDHSELERHGIEHGNTGYKEDIINHPHGLGLTPSAAYNLMGAYSERKTTRNLANSSKVDKSKSSANPKKSSTTANKEKKLQLDDQ